MHQTNFPHLPTHHFFPKMVNYHNPVVVWKDYCAYAIGSSSPCAFLQLISLDRGGVWNLACRGWTLLVSPSHRALDSHNIPNDNDPVLISSWEFVTTLDYEWSVIRRQRPFGWTIWVSMNEPFLLGFVAQFWALDWSVPFGRSTPLRAYPPSSL